MHGEKRLTENQKAHPAHIELAKVFGSRYLLGPPLSEKSIRLIAHLFTPEEAELARHLPFYYPRPAEKIARKLGRPVEAIQPLLDAMSKKRVILHLRGGYSLLPLIPGIFEYSLINGSDSEWHRRFAYLINDLFATGFSGRYSTPGKHPALRPVPVQKTIETKSQAVDADLMSELIDRHSELAVANVCQCRQSMHFTGHECKRSSPRDGCLIFGSFARGAVQRGDARSVSKDEMRDIVVERWEKKLLFWTLNVAPENPTAICTCCECCCHFIESVNKFNGRHTIAAPHFLAAVDQTLCTDCGKCVKACNTYAHTLQNKKHGFDQAKCLGCGLCVDSCSENAISMVLNPAYKPPSRGFKTMGLKYLTSSSWTGFKSRFAR